MVDAFGIASVLIMLLDAAADLARDDALGLADVLVLDALARDVVVLPLLAAAGLAVDIFFAAAFSALAAVVMALVAVFIACIADDIVLADAFALVAAAVILVAADVTLVAADDTVLAADAVVAELRLAVLRRAVLARVAVDREAVERDPVDRDAVLRVDLAAVLLLVVLAVPRADRAAVLRVDDGLAVDVLLLEMDFGRLAVPLDALRLTDLLRAVLAELRRVAARVVD